MRTQARLAGPLGADLVLTHLLTLVALAFVARLGMQPLAIVALGTTVYELAGRLVLGGLCNALDTVAAQVCSQHIPYLLPIMQPCAPCSDASRRCQSSKQSAATN